MPNHITNVLRAAPVVLAALRSETKIVDFSSVIPMPDELREVVVNGDENVVRLLNGALNLHPGADDLLAQLRISNVLRDIEAGGLKAWDDARFENFITMLRGYRKHGVTSWYDFGVERWGTKWNAYEMREIEGGVEFDTAWSAPHPVVAKLAEMFPDEKIEHDWADEDIGHNLGRCVYQFGSKTELPVADPVDFALTLTGSDREYYRKSPETGLWEYHETEEA